MAVFKCKTCGASLNFDENSTYVVCDYCDCKQFIPLNFSDEKKVNMFNRANEKLSKCDFDTAQRHYDSIIAEYPDEAEAYWGACLCKYGIEYVDDSVTGKKIPTCHRTNTTSIFDDDDFKAVCRCANEVAKAYYLEVAGEIDRIQKKILEIASKEAPYDIFISYKEKDPLTGKRTEDSDKANDLYTNLIEKGYKRVFFARNTLKNVGGRDYEPIIYAALNSAKVMILLATEPEYMNATWVKNEWSRYLKMMKNHPDKKLIVCHYNFDAYDLPEELRAIEALNMDSITFHENLMNSISNVLSFGKTKDAVSNERKVVIKNVSTFVSIADSVKEHWKNCKEETIINKSNYGYLYFHYQVLHTYDDAEKRVERKVSVVDSRGETIYQSDNHVTLKGGSSDKTYGARVDISDFKEGEYTLVCEVEGAVPYECTFTIVSDSVLGKKTQSYTGEVTTDNLLMRAEIFLYDRDFSNAVKYYDKVIDVDPTNAKAYIGKMCADLKLSEYDALKKCEIPIEEYSEFKKALRFSNDEGIAFVNELLLGYKENRYNAAIALKERGEHDGELCIKNAVEIFEKLGDYKDSKEKILECETLQKELKYRAAMERAKYAPKLAAIEFENLGNYKDSKKMIHECVNIYKESKYQDAKALFEKSPETSIRYLESIGDYKDASELLIKYKEFLLEKTYKFTKKSAKNNLSKAIENFGKIEDYKDSAELKERCKQLLKLNAEIDSIEKRKLKLKGSYDYELKRSKKSCTKLIVLFAISIIISVIQYMGILHNFFVIEMIPVFENIFRNGAIFFGFLAGSILFLILCEKMDGIWKDEDFYFLGLILTILMIPVYPIIRFIRMNSAVSVVRKAKKEAKSLAKQISALEAEYQNKTNYYNVEVQNLEN